MTKTKASGDIQKCYNIMVTGKVLDVGIEVLKSMKGDTSALVIEMRDHNKEQRGFNQEM